MVRSGRGRIFEWRFLDIVPEPAGEGVAGGGGHDDAGAFGELEPEQQANEGGVKGFSAGGGTGPGDPVVVAETFQGAIDPRVPGDTGRLPDELDSCFAVEVGTTADIFGAGVKMALERGGAARKGKPLKGSLVGPVCSMTSAGSNSTKAAHNSTKIPDHGQKEHGLERVWQISPGE